MMSLSSQLDALVQSAWNEQVVAIHTRLLALSDSELASFVRDDFMNEFGSKPCAGHTSGSARGKPCNPFNAYKSHRNKQLKQTHPQLSATERAARISLDWRSVPSQEREYWKKVSAKTMDPPSLHNGASSDASPRVLPRTPPHRALSRPDVSSKECSVYDALLDVTRRAHDNARGEEDDASSDDEFAFQRGYTPPTERHENGLDEEHSTEEKDDEWSVVSLVQSGASKQENSNVTKGAGRKAVAKTCRTTKDKNAPKRPRSAYIIFTQATRPRVKEENPGLKMSELAKLLGKEWRQIGTQEKARFNAAATEDRARYAREMDAYKKKEGTMCISAGCER